MAREIELKLSLAEQDIETLRALPMLASDAEYRGSTTLHNQYFDTPEQALAANRVALRIREDSGRHIQTLKTRGASQGGLHQRNEWEWDLPQPALDYDLLAAASWPPELADPALQRRIVPAFRTDFERSIWLLRRPSAAGGEALIELVLDLGEVTAGAGARDPLCEVELELKSGAAQDLYAVALELAAAVPLLVSDISKAERGYRLLREPRAETAARPLAGNVTVREAFLALAEQALNRISRGLGRWLQQCDWDGVDAAAEGLMELQAALDCFRPILPETSLVSLLTELAAVERELDSVLAWRRLLPRMDSDLASQWQAQQSEGGAARLDKLLRLPPVGCLLLECGRLLILDDWPPAAAKRLGDFSAVG